MRDNESDTRAPEILIIRRRGESDEDAHHGGVWKIAFADFMTALMTFFLVMWLVNAASKKTVSQIAAYFNPVKLSSKAPISRGVRDLTSLPEGELAPLTADARQAVHPATKPEKEVTPAAGGKNENEVEDKDETPSMPALRDPYRSGEAPQSAPPAKAKSLPTPAEPLAANATAKQNESRDAAIAAGNTQVAAASMEKEISTALRELKQEKLPKVEVKIVEDGMLISLTDTLDFEMFKLASAEPSAQVQPVMQKIAMILAERPENIIVRGHTDGRPYRSARYNNWKLSTDRAYSAYEMLVRGSLPDSRFMRLEGYADRALRTPSSPLASENRRIDILLWRGKL